MAGERTDGPALVWFRQDLRLADNPALAAAVASGRPVLPVYVLDDDTPGPWKTGGAARWWLHHSLATLGADLSEKGARLVLRRGRADEILPALVAETRAGAVYWNRCYELFAIGRDTRMKARFTAAGLIAESFNAALLREPWTMRTGAGGPFKVFTPFWKALRAGPAPEAPLRAPRRIRGAVAESDELNAWGLLPRRPNWAAQFPEVWTPGEAGALQRLKTFLDRQLKGYGAQRDRADLAVTSRLSPHLHWGEIGPRQVWLAVQARAEREPDLQVDAEKFLSEIAWREFSHHLLYHTPTLPEANWKPAFDRFPWTEDEAQVNSWQRGRTGYPIVDAGMRELWATGFMHNRVRMIVASFLIKDLMVHWRRGEDWFWDTLVDADLANNAASWQWVAGSGADAAPYFRIFNPVTQGERYDPDGAYVRRWVPELSKLDAAWIHAPWDAPEAVRAAAGVILGETYPHRIVDHGLARTRALEAYKSVSGGNDA